MTFGRLFGIVRTVKDVSVEEARTIVESGIPYLDVRTPLEFAAGHVPGALNVPLHLNGPEGMVPNPEFTELALLVLRGHESAIVGCRSGARSRIACDLLQPHLAFEPYHLTLGFEGKRDAFGRLSPGWQSTGLVETEARPEQTFEVLALLLRKNVDTEKH